MTVPLISAGVGTGTEKMSEAALLSSPTRLLTGDANTTVEPSPLIHAELTFWSVGDPSQDSLSRIV